MIVNTSFCKMAQPKCTICFEPILDLNSVNCVELQCRHSFHRPCILKWCVEKQECPLCRSKACEIVNCAQTNENEDEIIDLTSS